MVILLFQSPSPRGRRRQWQPWIASRRARKVSVPFSEGAAPPAFQVLAHGGRLQRFSPLLRGGGAASGEAGPNHLPEERFSPLLRGGGAARPLSRSSS